LGDADVTLEALSVYSDAGATAFDSYDGDLTEDILVVNEVNANVPGDYLVKYNVSDSSGNSAVEVVRTVHIVDSTPPVISILGINPVNIYIGDAYTDAGAEAMDNIDGNITPNITTINNVNNAVAGAYTVEYSVNDTAGNNATATRTVNVENHPPIAVDDSFAYPNNKTITIPVSVLLSNDYDPEGGKVSFVSLSQGTGGVASYSAILKRVIFKPAKGFNGLASFTYTIKDSVGLQSSATVWLSIVINELPDNLPPIAVDDTLSTNKVWTSIPVSKLLSNDSDPEGTTISFVSVSKASNNARLVSGFNQLLLIVKRGYTGTVTFSYVIKDANGLQSTGNVTVDVNNARLF